MVIRVNFGGSQKFLAALSFFIARLRDSKEASRVLESEPSELVGVEADERTARIEFGVEEQLARCLSC